MQQPSPRGSSLGPLLLAFVAGAIGGAAGALVVQPRGLEAGAVNDSGLRQSVAALDETEIRELVVDAWRMCVPKKVAAAYDAEHG